jgi:NADH-quinone oxidoreductase subunit I
VEPAENTDKKRYSPGERYAVTYEINLLRCIYCGFCEDACPTEAIVLEDIYELAYSDRNQALFTKDKLLDPPADNGKGTPQSVKPGSFTRSIPEMKDPV